MEIEMRGQGFLDKDRETRTPGGVGQGDRRQEFGLMRKQGGGHQQTLLFSLFLISLRS